MPAVARVGDTTSHGGVIISGASTCFSDGVPIARIGDVGYCPLDDHPSTFVIISGSGSTMAEGSPVARIGSACSCGAIVVSGGSWNDEG